MPEIKFSVYTDEVDVFKEYGRGRSSEVLKRPGGGLVARVLDVIDPVVVDRSVTLSMKGYSDWMKQLGMAPGDGHQPKKEPHPWDTITTGDEMWGGVYEIDIEDPRHPEHENWVNRYTPY